MVQNKGDRQGEVGYLTEHEVKNCWQYRIVNDKKVFVYEVTTMAFYSCLKSYTINMLLIAVLQCHIKFPVS